MSETVLITGGAGFIGSHLVDHYLQNTDDFVVCVDNFNTFYDPSIKRQNIKSHLSHERYALCEGDIRDKPFLESCFKNFKVKKVVHLAAMAGVRPSIQDPDLYFDVNVTGTLNILEACRKYKIDKLLFASSSSVYGNNKKVPFSETDNVDYPVSPYAATKKAGELMCYNYHHLYQIPVVCLRFFTVYGPRQRPEMAIHKFARLIGSGEEIPVYNYGNCLRDYTYIQDIIHGIVSIVEKNFTYDVVNLGESATISTNDLLQLIEESLGKKGNVNLLPSQPGDVEKTYADIRHAKQTYGYQPQFPIKKGISEFVSWYLNQA